MAESTPREYEADVDQTDGMMNLQILNQPVVEHYEFNLKGTVKNELKNAVNQCSQVSISTQDLVMVLCSKDETPKKVLMNDCPLRDYTKYFGEEDLMKIMYRSEAPNISELPTPDVGGYKVKAPRH